MMHMTLYWSVKVTLLVDRWRTDSWPSYLLTLLVCAVSSTFYQYLEDRRLRLRSAASSAARDLPEPSSASPLISKAIRIRPVNSAKLASVALFGLSSAIGYLLMLAIMSFNGGVFLSIVSGLTIGYGIFRCDYEEIPAVESPCACA
ncbi:hypothetical protein SAY86_027033 [Trapa natans]|uniref:Copper transport protein n=1 Tax=Trapa natans TaxID=22666 RepID=A0AAN7KGS2_TRANT|nr:hypothetical protein SAY86_027033 [Trapa natans]